MPIEQEDSVMNGKTTPLGAVWRKSSRCHPSDSYCLEAAALPGDTVGIRDSKIDGGSVLTISSQAWRAFVATLTAR
ncbi:DUF397 domain-containing protein [Streptomyces sp. MCAF7]